MTVLRKVGNGGGNVVVAWAWHVLRLGISALLVADST